MGNHGIGERIIHSEDELDQIRKGEGSVGDSDHHYVLGLPIECPMTSRLWEHRIHLDHKSKILQKTRMVRLTSSLHKNLLLLPNPIAFIWLNGLLTLVPLHTYVPIILGSLPIHSLILHVPFILVTNESFMPLVRVKSRSQFIKALITDMPLSITFSTVLRLEQIYYLSLILPKLVPRSNLLRTSARSLILIMNLLVLLISPMACSDYHAPS